MQTVKQRRRSNQLISNINVIGFVSVLLVLLYILLAPAIDPRDRRMPDVNLPCANHPVPMPGADEDDAMIIAINRDGHIYFGNDHVDLKALPVVIRERVKHGSPKVVYFRADARAKYKFVRDVLEAVQTGGLEKIAFLVEQRKTNGHSSY